MDIDSIPHYKASYPLQTQFVTNADACGLQIFTQLRRTGNVALYERRKIETNRVDSYEVIIVKTVRAGTIYTKGGKPTEKDSESYPGAQSFGKLGWSTQSLGYAHQLFDEKVAIQQKALDNPNAPKRGRNSGKSKSVINIPDGEFTMKMLIANTKLTQANLHPIVKQWQKNNQIVVVRTIKSESGRGRPSMVYSKA